MTVRHSAPIYDFDGRTAVVTGGGGVLCREMCLALARHGARVAVVDIELSAAAATAGAIEAEGGRPWPSSATSWSKLPWSRPRP